MRLTELSHRRRKRRLRLLLGLLCQPRAHLCTILHLRRLHNQRRTSSHLPQQPLALLCRRVAHRRYQKPPQPVLRHIHPPHPLTSTSLRHRPSQISRHRLHPTSSLHHCLHQLHRARRKCNGHHCLPRYQRRTKLQKRGLRRASRAHWLNVAELQSWPLRLLQGNNRSPRRLLCLLGLLHLLETGSQSLLPKQQRPCNKRAARRQNRRRGPFHRRGGKSLSLSPRWALTWLCKVPHLLRQHLWA